MRNPYIDIFLRRSQAYKKLFKKQGNRFLVFILSPFKRRAYRKVFDPEAAYAQIVLADLRRYCGGTGSLVRESDRLTNVQNGRYQVWDRIRTLSNLTDEQIITLVENMNNE